MFMKEMGWAIKARGGTDCWRKVKIQLVIRDGQHPLSIQD